MERDARMACSTLSLRWIVMSCGLSALLGLTPHARAAGPTQEGEPIVIGHRHKIESKLMSETRGYIVHKPVGYDFSDERYAVIVLLDGTANIHHVSATVDELAKTGRTMPALIVGIENTDRQRDMTPPITNTKLEFPPPKGAIGGAERFLSFIADELLPELDRNYRTRPARILIGHSLGGLFTAYALLHRPELFKAYIAVSPSLWWDNQAFAKQAEQFVIDHKDLQTAVYMTMGNEGGSMLGGAQKFAGSLASAYTIGVNFQHWPDESHGSVVIRSVYEGMKWLSESYYIHDPMRMYEESGLESFDKRFARISQYLGYEVKVPEHTLMHVQYFLMEEQRHQEAVEVLERVLELYPQSPGAHYELGRAYVAMGEKSRGEEQFKQTLGLYPGHAGARSELEKLSIDPNSVVAEATVKPSILRSYVGEYRYSDETSAVTFEDGKLFMEVHGDKRELRPRSNTTFFAIESDREYTFNKQGRVTSLTIQLPEFSYESRKVK